jgi:hypothetical protein
VTTALAVQNQYQPAKANWYKIQTHDHECTGDRWSPGGHNGCWLPGELLQHYKFDVGASYINIAGMMIRTGPPGTSGYYISRALNDSDLLATECYNDWAWIAPVNNHPVTFQGAANTATQTLTGFIHNGEVIYFSSITTTTGIETDTPYYVVNIGGAGGTYPFQLSLTPGGPPLTLTGDGSGHAYILSYTLANHSDTDDDWWMLPYTFALEPTGTPIPAKGTVPGSFGGNKGAGPPTYVQGTSNYIFTEGVDFTMSSTPITEFGRTRYVININFVDQAALPNDNTYFYPCYHLNISNQDLSGIIWDYGTEFDTSFALSEHYTHVIFIGTIPNMSAVCIPNSEVQSSINAHAAGLLMEGADMYQWASFGDTIAEALSVGFDVAEVYNPDGGISDWALDMFAMAGQFVGAMGVDDTHSLSEFNNGCTWVNADELTKEAIFAGLKSGQCYAENTGKLPPDKLLKIESVTSDPGTVTITSNWPAIYYWYTANSWPDQTVTIDGTPTPVRTTGSRWSNPWNGFGGGVLSDTYTITETDVFVRAALVATPSITPPFDESTGGNVYISPMRVLPAGDVVTGTWDDAQPIEVEGLFNIRLAG